MSSDNKDKDVIYSVVSQQKFFYAYNKCSFPLWMNWETYLDWGSGKQKESCLMSKLTYTERHLLNHLTLNWLQSLAKQRSSKVFVRSYSLILNWLARCMKVPSRHFFFPSCNMIPSTAAAVVNKGFCSMSIRHTRHLYIVISVLLCWYCCIVILDCYILKAIPWLQEVYICFRKVTWVRFILSVLLMITDEIYQQKSTPSIHLSPSL